MQDDYHPSTSLILCDRQLSLIIKLGIRQSRKATTIVVVSVDGVFGCEATCFFKRVAERLSFIWNKPYSIVFAILRATNLCLSGSGIKWTVLKGSEGGTP